MIRVSIQQQDFDSAAELVTLQAEGTGGIASFTGIVRGDGGLATLTLEHYPGMTHAALTALAEDAQRRWPLSGITLIHRVGELAPGDRIVLVATASAHRAAALEACAFLIDRLKTDAPFWKKERFIDGRERWVDALEGDTESAARW